MSIGHLAAPRPQYAGFGPLFALAAAIAATGFVAFGGLFRLHADAALPLASLLLFLFAALIAAAGWRRRARQGGRVTYWDVAGALVFIGIVTGAMVDPDQLVRIVERG